MTDTRERELKLVPASETLLDVLADVERLGPFTARGRRRELQHNSFFDSASGGLRQARVGFRRRRIEGQPLATWSIKGASQNLRGVVSRDEIELRLDPDTPPALALTTLQDAARSRGAPAVAEAVAEGLAAGGLPLKTPFLETETDRRIVDLVTSESEVELALDRTRLIGHDFAEIEVEAELKRGDDAALDGVRSAIEALGDVRESSGSKLSRAVAHVAACRCA